MNSKDAPKIGVLVVAYNAETTLAPTLDRIPTDFAQRLSHVLVCDDASVDETYSIGVQYKATSTLPLTVIKHRRNRGYGGNQKVGYRWAAAHQLDVIVLLHGDGQYAPEVIESLVEPIVKGDADAVFGSRMLERGGALAGGMPLYKFVGNKILTTAQNRLAGLELSEWHSGYRAYRVSALADLDFDSMSDDFDFDTQIILGLHGAGHHIAEVAIPTYYGDEICHVNGLAYAKDVMLDTVSFKLRSVGFGRGTADVGQETAYLVKPSAHSSHGRLLDWVSGYRRSDRRPTALDVGCSDGVFGASVRDLGFSVTGTDLVKHVSIGDRIDGFVEADLNVGLPQELGTGYDLVIAADVLEHVIDPGQLLDQIRGRLAGHGRLLISVPNISHWYPRFRIASGWFDYDQRGPLDEGHVRFFTRRSFERLLRAHGMTIVRRDAVGVPVDVVNRSTGPVLSTVAKVFGAIDRRLARLWPTMFGYQFLYEVEPA